MNPKIPKPINSLLELYEGMKELPPETLAKIEELYIQFHDLRKGRSLEVAVAIRMYVLECEATIDLESQIFFAQKTGLDDFKLRSNCPEWAQEWLPKGRS